MKEIARSLLRFSLLSINGNAKSQMRIEDKIRLSSLHQAINSRQVNFYSPLVNYYTG